MSTYCVSNGRAPRIVKAVKYLHELTACKGLEDSIVAECAKELDLRRQL